MKHNFRGLVIWQESMELAKMIFNLTKTFPANEQFGLKSQLNRCAVSVPSNIAEGSSRTTEKSFVQFLSIALGSCFEIETQLLLAAELDVVTSEQIKAHVETCQLVQKRIHTFINKLSNN